MSYARFCSEPEQAGSAVVWDASQRAVLQLADHENAAIIGAPGSGKTSVLIEVVAERIRAGRLHAAEVLVLTPDRRSATALRDRLAGRIGVPTPGPLARSVASFAHSALATARAQRGEPEPRLLTGAEHDHIFAELLAGEIEDGRDGLWPEHLGSEVRGLRGFRTQLRDLAMRVEEYDLGPEGLRRLGGEHGREDWLAAARFFEEYREVLAGFRGAFYDSTELVAAALRELERPDPVSVADALKLVIFDDAQDSGEATLRLARALRRRGASILAFGDPDISTGAFRGARPEVLGRLSSVIKAPVCTLVLAEVHRHAAPLRNLVSAVTARIGTASAGRQRAATSARGRGDETREAADAHRASEAGAAARAQQVATLAPGDGSGGGDGFAAAESETLRTPQLRIFESPDEQLGGIARLLRERHLLGGVPWQQMAVIARTSTGVAGLEAGLAVREVPTRRAGEGIALRDDAGVRALLTALRIAAVAESPTQTLDADTAAALLTGPLGGFDAVALRRFGTLLQHEEWQTEGSRRSPELIAEALAVPGVLATLDAPLARRAHRLAQSLASAREQAAEGAALPELLWGLWQRSGLAGFWLHQSRQSGILAEQAEQHLDAAVALFAAAQRFVERNPDRAVSSFIAEVLAADVPEDTLAARSLGGAVTVATPSALLGTEFELVIVAGLQEGVWPNLRVRGSLLGVQQLVELVRVEESPDAQRGVLHDELRLFAQAISRSRGELVLTAVAGEDDAPSPFTGFIPEAGDAELSDAEPSQIGVSAQAAVRAAVPGVSAAERAERRRDERLTPLSLRGIVARLRRSALRGDAAAASGLAWLAREGAPGADPAEWWGLRGPSTEAPLRVEGEPPLPVAPSRLQAFETCPLDWVISQLAGSGRSTSQGLGILVHAAVEQLDKPSEESEESQAHSPSGEDLYDYVRSRWNELSFESEWLSARELRFAEEVTGRLAGYLREQRESGATLIAAEFEFRVPVAAALLKGTIDRVELGGDGAVRVVDLKTGRSEPLTDSAVAEHVQLAAYQFALLEGAVDGVPPGAPSAGAALVVLAANGLRGQTSCRIPVQPPMSLEQRDAFGRRITNASEGMGASTFLAQVGTHCFDPYSYGSCRIHTISAVTHG